MEEASAPGMLWGEGLEKGGFGKRGEEPVDAFY
jgi:hypothetical protein